MTEEELHRMEEAWESASPGNLRAWVPALLEEARRLRAVNQALAGEFKGIGSDVRSAALEEAARVAESFNSTFPDNAPVETVVRGVARTLRALAADTKETP